MATWSDAKPRGTIPVASLDNETRDQLLFLKDLISQWAQFDDADSTNTQLRIGLTKRVVFDADFDSYLTSPLDDQLDLFLGGVLEVAFRAGSTTFNSSVVVADPLLDQVMATAVNVDMRARNSLQGFLLRAGSGGTSVALVQTSAAGADEDTWAQFNRDGSVDLFHNNVKKFETTLEGVDVLGNILDFLIATDTTTNFIVRNSIGGALLRVDNATGLVRLAQSSAAGAFEDDWIIGTRNGAVTLHHNAVAKLRTALHTTADIGMGAEVVDGGGTFRPVGMNIAPIFANPASQSFDLAHNGHMWIQNLTAARSFTASNDANIPIGAMYLVQRLNTGTCTIVQGTGVTLRFLDGGGAAPPSGNRSLARAGVCSVYKEADTIFSVWGTGLT